ncbi:hypothetical protein [Methylobacterium trifolii]|uniref:Uncharacterized protein n=1 Tax=Methylobacterium trifolii TaxID=1003092 RepID=A0ABQ4U4A9_9HYPH|nr:hypothetical protein [Methylobacterium trifolii]GJE60915.1 hypothetical protein MPOCJGCO_3034 [Methylobacterium trifolii]
MSFLLRAALVIGTLSYLAATRGESGPAAPGRPPEAAGPLAALREGVPSALSSALPAVWNAMPQPARDGLAREAIAALSRRAEAPPSRDTLAEADRRAAWRGIEPR